MTRLRSRIPVPVLALIVLSFLSPRLSMALPQGEAGPSAAERHETARGRLSQLWSLLSALWAENGSILDPNGTPGGASSGSGAEPDAGSSGDNGSILDPDGRH